MSSKIFSTKYQKAGKWRQILCVGIIRSTPCDLYVIIRRCDRTQVGFAESNNTADNRANIGGTIIGAPIVGQ